MDTQEGTGTCVPSQDLPLLFLRESALDGTAALAGPGSELGKIWRCQLTSTKRQNRHPKAATSETTKWHPLGIIFHLDFLRHVRVCCDYETALKGCCMAIAIRYEVYSLLYTESQRYIRRAEAADRYFSIILHR